MKCVDDVVLIDKIRVCVNANVKYSKHYYRQLQGKQLET